VFISYIISYMKAKYNAETTLTPTTVHPVCRTCLLLNPNPISHIKCRSPLKLWNVKGSAIPSLSRNFATNGKLPKAAASDALSRCQPRRGATR